MRTVRSRIGKVLLGLFATWAVGRVAYAIQSRRRNTNVLKAARLAAATVREARRGEMPSVTG